MSDKLLTPAEVADKLQVEVHWIYDRARHDGMPHYRRGVVLRFDLAAGRSCGADGRMSSLAQCKRFWWRLKRPFSRWLDRRYQARHLREYGWPIGMGMGPFSHPESRWHECPGHEWERFDWPYGRHKLRGHRPERVTRCRKCGAPRCGTGENDPMRCCTLERHHSEPHDYLSGERVEVGG